MGCILQTITQPFNCLVMCAIGLNTICPNNLIKERVLFDSYSMGIALDFLNPYELWVF